MKFSPESTQDEMKNMIAYNDARLQKITDFFNIAFSSEDKSSFEDAYKKVFGEQNPDFDIERAKASLPKKLREQND